jgi:ABC-type sugar transport system ATPase subunit
VLELIKRLSSRGLTIVMVTHNLEHLWQVCNRVLVMRRGRKVADMMSLETSLEEVVAYITGAKEPSSAMPSSSAVVE